jgi:myo-inositol catabolism protein IolC
LALGHDRRLFLLPLEATGDVVGRDAEAGTDDGALLLDAIEQALARTEVTAAEVGVLLDVPRPAPLVERARELGLTVVIPADDRGAERFAFAQGDAFGQHIETLAPDLTSVRVRWHPDDDPDVKKEQALGLTKLAAWLHETDRSLLIELLVAPPGADASDPEPGRTAEAIRAIRDLGIEADLWSVAPPTAAGEVEQLAEVVRDAGRDEVGLLLRLGSTPGSVTVPATWAQLAAYRGVVLAPSAWADELASSAGSERTREEVVRALGDRVAATLDRVAATDAS